MCFGIIWGREHNKIKTSKMINDKRVFAKNSAGIKKRSIKTKTTALHLNSQCSTIEFLRRTGIEPNPGPPQEKASTRKKWTDDVRRSIEEKHETPQYRSREESLEELEEKLKEHNSILEAEKLKKQQEDAAKGRALMSTFLEHVKELVGDQEGLQQTVEPMIAANPEGMGRVMEIVSKASKKYAENNKQPC